MNRPELEELVGKRVKATDRRGGVWEGVLVGLHEHPTMIIDQVDGFRRILPQHFTVAEEPSAVPPQDRPSATDHTRIPTAELNQLRQRAERAEAAIARVRALHRDAFSEGLCTECSGEYRVTWPCDTARALNGETT